MSSKASRLALAQIITLYGSDALLFLLKCLVGQLDFKDKGQKDQQLKLQLLLHQIEQLPNKPNFVSLVCRAFEDIQMHVDFLNRFTRALRLTLGLEIMIALSLVRSHQTTTQTEGLKFLRTKLSDLVTPGKEEKLPEPVLNELLMLVFTGVLFDTKARDTVLKALQRAYTQADHVPRLLALLTDNPQFLEFKADLFMVQSELSDTGAFLKSVLTSIGPAKLLEDLGYDSMVDLEKLKAVLRGFGKLDEASVATIVGMMATSQGLGESIAIALHGAAPKPEGKATAWNVEVFLTAVKHLAPNINWTNVIRKLDYPDFKLFDQRGAIFIATLFKAATGAIFPVEALLQKWTNVGGQLSFLRWAVVSPEHFSFANTNRIQPVEGAFPVGGTGKLNEIISNWHSHQLVEALLSISTENGYFADVSTVLEFPKSNCPAVLLLSLASANIESDLRMELLTTLCSMFILTHHPNSTSVIQRLWSVNMLIVVDNMIRLYSRDPANLSRILDIAQELQELKTILSIVPYHVFTMDLAALAARREYLNLEKWLADMIKENTDLFARSIIRYIKGRLFDHPSESPLGPTVETMHLFIRSMQANILLLSPPAQEELKEILPALLPSTATVNPSPVIAQPTIYRGTPAAPAAFDISSAIIGAGGNLTPSQLPFGPGPTPTPPASYSGLTKSNTPLLQSGGAPAPQPVAGASGSPAQEPFPEDIIVEANQMFQELYEGRITIEQMLNKLKELRSYRNPRENKIFACIIHTLFDEYRYFAKYPDKELQITATLFGALIQHRLITSLPLGHALKYVLDSLKKPPGTKMFKFGLFALEEFISRLPEWPQYIAHIVQIQHLHQLRPEFIAHLQQMLPNPHGGNEPPHEAGEPLEEPVPSHPILPQLHHPAASGSATIVTPTAEPDSTGASLPIRTLLKPAKPFDTPDEETTDRIKFIVNNVSTQNVDDKSNDLKRVLKPKDYDYFGHYLVSKRVSTEPNFHKVYLTVLELINDPVLFKKVTDHTFNAMRLLLASAKIRNSIPERTLLKNLGIWLGNITLGRNKPLYHKDLPMKELILQAYEQGILVAVVPFVSKVLHAAAHSKIFKPPNPWTIALLRLLIEIYRCPDIKATIQYEVELLLRHLEVEMNTLEPTELLITRRPYAGVDTVDFNNPPRLPDPSPPPPSGEDKPATPVTQWLAYQNIFFSPKLELFARVPELRAVAFVALNRAIEEIIEPVVDRVVSIASTTTQKLALKDFATEPDENKLVHAANCMVQSLASSLASVICKEPLRVSVLNHLRTAIKDLPPAVLTSADPQALDFALQSAITDNFDLASAVIEKISTERAIADVNEQLAPAVEARKAHRDQRQAQPYYDVNHFSGRYPAALPDMLRSHIGGVHPHQLVVYEEFVARVQQQQAQQIAAATGPSPSPSLSASTGYPIGLSLSNDVSLNDLPVNSVVHTPKPDIQAYPVRSSPPAETPVRFVEEPTDPVEGFNLAFAELEQTSKQEPPAALISLPPDHILHDQIKRTVAWIARVPNRVEFSTALVQKLLKQVHEVAALVPEAEPNLLRDVLVHVMGGVVSTLPKLRRDVASALISWEDERKFSKSLLHSLLRLRLLKLVDFDVHLAKQLDKGRNKTALDVSIWLLRKCIVEDHFVLPSEVFNTVDELEKLSERRGTAIQGAEGLGPLLQQVRAIATEPEKLKKSSSAARNFGLPAQARPFTLKVATLFGEWVALLASNPPTESAQVAFIQQLQQLGLYAPKDPAQSENEIAFYRAITEYAVQAFFQAQAELDDDSVGDQIRDPYKAVDALAKMIFLLVKYYSDKVSLLGKIFSQVALVMNGDFTTSPPDFNQRPYYRLLVNLLAHFSVPDPAMDGHQLAFLFQFADVLHHFQPKKYLGFAFAWVELMSHRIFMPKLLRDQRGWVVMQQLLVDLLEFLEPFLRKAKLTPEIRFLYKGTLRVLLVLLHDFPEFLCDYHFSFCDVLPPTCIQMRNLILSAFPRTMKLPDPLMPNLKVDLLPEINSPPRILSTFAQALVEARIKNELDALLKNPREVQHLIGELLERIQLPPQEAAIRGTKYNIPLINAVVLYAGSVALSIEPSGRTSMDLFRFLSINLDNEGRYFLFNAITNQLRYPNSHTHYFSMVLLVLFQDAPEEIIQEQITRVLLERLIAHRPHPWGLLITFIELIKNPRYDFWNRPFTRCSPEIERVFLSVARSCVPQASQSS